METDTAGIFAAAETHGLAAGRQQLGRAHGAFPCLQPGPMDADDRAPCAAALDTIWAALRRGCLDRGHGRRECAAFADNRAGAIAKNVAREAEAEALKP